MVVDQQDLERDAGVDERCVQPVDRRPHATLLIVGRNNDREPHDPSYDRIPLWRRPTSIAPAAAKGAGLGDRLLPIMAFSMVYTSPCTAENRHAVHADLAWTPGAANSVVAGNPCPLCCERRKVVHGVS